MKTKSLILAAALVSTACSPKIYQQDKPPRQIIAESLVLDYQGALVRTLDKKSIDRDTIPIDFTYWGGWKDSKLYTDRDTLGINNDGVAQEFILWISGNDTTVLDIYKQFNPGKYNASFREQNQGKVNVVIPQVYELTNILLSLTPASKAGQVDRDTDYYQRVQEYFSAYKEHPVVHALASEIEKGHYINIRDNSAAYVFEGQSISLSATHAGFRARDQFKKLLPLIQDFAAKSDFHSFYQSEQPYYEKLISMEREKAQVKEVWDWLQGQFPARTNTFRIIMSPLEGGWHSIRSFEDNGFRENIIFMSAPALAGEKPMSQEEADALAMRRAFTEMDHHYVNPISDIYLTEINDAMADLGKWNRKGSYNSPYQTFNEYMTWAVFGLFVHERLGEEAYDRIIPQPTEFMENNRGFVRFGESNAHLLELFKKYDGKKKIPELYPELLQWVKNVDSSSS